MWGRKGKSRRDQLKTLPWFFVPFWWKISHKFSRIIPQFSSSNRSAVSAVGAAFKWLAILPIFFLFNLLISLSLEINFKHFFVVVAVDCLGEIRRFGFYLISFKLPSVKFSLGGRLVMLFHG